MRKAAVIWWCVYVSFRRTGIADSTKPVSQNGPVRTVSKILVLLAAHRTVLRPIDGVILSFFAQLQIKK